MRLCSYTEDGTEHLGWVEAGQVAPVAGAAGDHELLAPLPRPGKVVAVGLNYLGHATEQDRQPPSEPLVFAKLPSAVVGHGAEIVWDPALARQVDAEAELAVMIGRRARHVGVADALDHALGYTACNDVSARDLQAADGQWVVGQLISWCSASFTLEPGDVIATGTPPGVGIYRDPPRLLADGDEVVVEIERIGRLANRCRHRPAP
jgi:2-keto-4-pentenoate hydratase/2-oxohepta-3-ene-1,7-dioic acid hydratase in catechol pathway